MYHPNSELERCKTREFRGTPQELKRWDQRIPNDPIAERTFLLQRPPIIYNRQIQTTNPCIGVDSRWLILNRNLINSSEEYWANNFDGQKYAGLSTYNQPKLTKEQRKKLKREHPNKPWIYGINKNIDAESKVFGLDYYNPEDCISPKVQKNLRKESIEANLSLCKNYHQITENYLTKTPFWWDNTSKMRMQEPVSFDYTDYLNNCAKKRGLWKK